MGKRDSKNNISKKFRTPANLLMLSGLLAFGASTTADAAITVQTGLRITVPTSAPTTNVKISQPYGRKGPTSIRFFPLTEVRSVTASPNPKDPVGSKYCTKDRDLGQTFKTPTGSAFKMTAVTLRTGVAPYGGSIDSAKGSKVYIQIMQVSGTPTINNNGTTGTTTVSSSYPNQAMADDYITGETYTTLLVVKGGTLPTTLKVGQSNTTSPTTSSAGTLLTFDISDAGGIVLQPNTKYAFLVGFENPKSICSFPLDNWDYLNQSSATATQKQNGPYANGHAIRREGRVENPYNNLRDALENVDANDPVDMSKSCFLPIFTDRLAQQPGTWGRPDVDTYRDLTFWLQGTNVSGLTKERLIGASSPIVNKNTRSLVTLNGRQVLENKQSNITAGGVNAGASQQLIPMPKSLLNK